jgi:hypothetical protein
MVPPKGAKDADKPLRLDFGVVGKHLFRVRERHVADHLVPLISCRAVGAAKLDLVLRCIALSPQHAGKRQSGAVLPACSWELLHDLCKVGKNLGAVEPGLDAPPEVIKLKRKWVGQQLKRLESLKLVRRELRPGNRPRLTVLRDDGSGEPFDDPDGNVGNTYVTILGSVIASHTMANWGAPELTAFLAAMAAERSEGKGKTRQPHGSRYWYRPLAWFADLEGLYGPDERVRMGFSVPTLERGIASLEKAGLMGHRRIHRNPRTGRRLKGPRNYYSNNFASLRDKATVVDAAEIEDLPEGSIEF